MSTSPITRPGDADPTVGNPTRKPTNNPLTRRPGRGCLGSPDHLLCQPTRPHLVGPLRHTVTVAASTASATLPTWTTSTFFGLDDSVTGMVIMSTPSW